MSKAINSPTGRLLRNSRLFSIPAPLPQPQVGDTNAGGQLRASETATLPYPIRQAIATPSSSRHRGDWGLKRALPLKKTSSTSSPFLRINAIDNLEHITDFESAADHTQNLQKWQEMGMPMVARVARNTMSGSNFTGTSVFEDYLDNTVTDESTSVEAVLGRLRSPKLQQLAPDAMVTTHDGKKMKVAEYRTSLAKEAARLRLAVNDSSSAQLRWKTQGPWLAGMTEDEFERYLARSFRKKGNKAGFLEFLTRVRVEQKRREATKLLRDEGRFSVEDSAANVVPEVELEEHELSDYIKRLRDGHTNLSSDLSRLMQEYFDLPAFAAEDDSTANSLQKSLLGSLKPDADIGPPATHPSAGLSYVRTNAIMENHPQLGPQAHRTPIQARVLRPRKMAQGAVEVAKLGVGGFVASDTTRAGANFRHQPGTHGHVTDTLDPELEGGNKVWVQPQRAYVDEKGRIKIELLQADDKAVEVKTGVFKQTDDLPSPSSLLTQSLGSRGYGRSAATPPPGTSGNANYGTALPDFRLASRARGLDDEVRQLQGQGGRGNTLDHMRDLIDRQGRQ